MSVKLSFKPKAVTKKILSGLGDRAYEVIVHRYGLLDDAEPKTLEAIGKKYGITRERVRQIENAALTAIKKSTNYSELEPVLAELKGIFVDLGAVLPEEDALATLAKDSLSQNHLYLYLVLGDDFTLHKEDEHFVTRWSVDPEMTSEVHDSIKRLYENLSDDELISESEIIDRFLGELKINNQNYKNEEIVKRWLALSKKIGKNPLSEYGRTDSSNVNARGIKDYAYLIMRKHGSPLHFREVAKMISDTFKKKTHVATTHNELIKDPRFVLVGRGMYGLTEWGYEPGVVRDVIAKILKKEGPMDKDEVVNRVLKERYLKRNTVLVNLQNPKYFKKNKQGLYTVA